MSMPAWLNDAHPLSNGDHGAFHHTPDPSMAFMQNTPNPLEYSQVQQNGSALNGSYPTQSLIPSKRSRPREDSVAASPGQTPGAIPGTRSQTPQQTPYPGFQGSVNGSHQFQGNTYQPFPNASNTTSPSPVMQNQMFNPQALPQQMQTGSPALFSPPPQNFHPQASPVSSEHASRNNTPQNGGQAYAQGMSYTGASSQSFNPTIATNSPGAPLAQYNQAVTSMQQQQRMHEIRQQQLMRQLQANNTAVQNRRLGMQMNPPTGTPAQMANYSMATRAQQAQAAQQTMIRSSNPEQFIRTIAQFMQQRQLPFNPNPTAAGRPINLYQLFFTVMKQGGSRRFTSGAQWAHLAANLHVPQQQLPAAAQDLHNYWQNNLAIFESSYIQQQKQRAMNEQMKMTGQFGEAAPQGQWSPARQPVSQSPGQQLHRPMNTQLSTQPDYPNQGRLGQNQDTRNPQQNGWSTPQPSSTQFRQPISYTSQATSALPPQSTALDNGSLPAQAASVAVKQEARPASSRKSESNYDETPRVQPIPPELSPKMLPKGSPLSHGGLHVVWLANKRESADEQIKAKMDNEIPLIDEIEISRPWLPSAEEFGLIDIRALTLSLRSGLHAEVRLALDSLSRLSSLTHHSHQALKPDLQRCEELLEVLIDCAEEQLDMLAENTTEISDEMLINSYDDMLRGCKVETETLLEIPKFGDLHYKLDHAVDRLLCITTILRNFSYPPVASSSRLAEPFVINFITAVIRYLGTRNMLLRTHQNTLNLSKDIIILLSNISQEIDLPSKEDALCILHFLLSFAPLPLPTDLKAQELAFSHYDPLKNRYYPYAVDTLAKLLARDDPNRTFYRLIFLADSASSTPYEMLTRTFGLAIAGIPSQNSPDFLKTIRNQSRAPVIAQGLLSAEILSGLIPSSEHSLARSWLTSQDCFASSLIEIALLFGDSAVPPTVRYPNGRYTESDRSPSNSIAQHSVAVLAKLAERSKDPDNPNMTLPSSIIPKKRRFLDAMKSDSLNGNLLRQLCTYAGMKI